MGCLISFFKLLILPIIWLFYIWWVIILVIWNLIKLILSFISGISFNQSSFSYSNSYKNSKKKSNKYDKYNRFDKAANLWGLSNEEKEIAKQEGMSAADFIEAEERDDDELLTDE